MSELSALAERLEVLEAHDAIRKVLTRYMALCDTLGPDTPMEELGALFARDAVWAGKGARYGAAFGGHEGRAAILAMLDAYRGPPPHFAFNAHYLASEAIAVTGPTAEGSWMMLQCSTYADGRSDLRSARLEVGFVLEDGAWRIARFDTENLFSRAIGPWSDGAPIPVPTPIKGE